MIAGGSGITPMFQVAQGILRNPYDQTKVFLIYANVSEEDILLRKEFDKWARDHRARFKVSCLVPAPCCREEKTSGFKNCAQSYLCF